MGAARRCDPAPTRLARRNLSRGGWSRLLRHERRPAARAARTACEGRALDRVGVPGRHGGRLRVGGQARLRRCRGHGLDRSRQPGCLRAATALAALPGADPGDPRAVPDHHPAGVDDRPVDEAAEGAQFAAELLGAQTVVVHPPFRWQREYSRGFPIGLETARPGRRAGIRFAVENMFPCRVRGRESSAYTPSWDVAADRAVTGDYTLDLSHTAVSQSDALAMLDGHERPDGSRPCRPTAPVWGGMSIWCPAAAASRAPRCWNGSPRRAFDGHVIVEINTRRALDRAEREADLAEALAFCRLHLVAPQSAAREP